MGTVDCIETHKPVKSQAKQRILSSKATISKMSRIFSWEYFSFLTVDETAAYKELLVIPFMVGLLFFVWMKLVRGEGKSILEDKDKTNTGMSAYAAYQDALANEVDSGTELDSPNEDEGEGEKEEAEKKDD